MTVQQESISASSIVAYEIFLYSQRLCIGIDAIVNVARDRMILVLVCYFSCKWIAAKRPWLQSIVNDWSASVLWPML